MSNKDKQILQTLSFFDVFSQALSKFEIYEYLNFKCSLSDIEESLELMGDRIGSKDGFYFLPGRDLLVEERSKRYNYFKRKIKIAKNFSKIISFIPSVRAVAVSNIISSHNLRDGSDIDFFIITRKNKIWLTRFFCAGIAKILNLRPNKKTKRDKICLSFYISEDNLNLEKYLYSEDDFYFIYWIVGLEFLLDKDNISSKLISENNWLRKYLPNLIKDSGDHCLSVFSRKEKCFWEKICKNLQIKIMPEELKKQECSFGGVVLKDDIIKLFLEDKRPLFIEKFNDNLKKYL
jgi:hypothetical protein